MLYDQGDVCVVHVQSPVWLFLIVGLQINVFGQQQHRVLPFIAFGCTEGASQRTLTAPCTVKKCT